MPKLIVAYLGAALTLAVLDMLWLSQVGPKLYKPIIGELLSNKVAWQPAVAFYLIFIAGLIYFAVAPALKTGEWTRALISGAILGFVAYATYDLTNQATLKVWSIRITLADIAWGTVLSGLSSVAGYFAARTLVK